jgi:hypothetical protein
MSREQFEQVLKLVPSDDRGVYWFGLQRFTNGKVVTTRKGTVKVPLELNLADLTDRPNADLRDVFMPTAADNTKLVPLIVFVDPEKFLATQPKEPE